MIEKIRIRDYRSCHDTMFELQPDLSVLIGPNGSGKTTVMNAFLLLRQLAFNKPRHNEVEAMLDNSKLKVWFRTDQKRLIFDADIKHFTKADNTDLIVDSDEK